MPQHHGGVNVVGAAVQRALHSRLIGLGVVRPLCPQHLYTRDAHALVHGRAGRRPCGSRGAAGFRQVQAAMQAVPQILVGHAVPQPAASMCRLSVLGSTCSGRRVKRGVAGTSMAPCCKAQNVQCSCKPVGVQARDCCTLKISAVSYVLKPRSLVYSATAKSTSTFERPPIERCRAAPVAPETLPSIVADAVAASAVNAGASLRPRLLADRC